MSVISIKVTSKPDPTYTTRQVMRATGRSESQINTMMNTIAKDNETKLDHCYPYPHTEEDKDKATGPKHIVGNKKLKDFLDYCKTHPK